METSNVDENNYKEKLRKELERLCNEGKKFSNKLTLEEKLIKKVEELKHQISKSELISYKYFIMINSLFFLKGNNFKNDNYFSLINNSIYKYFYQLSLHPTNEEFKKFQNRLQNLEYGGGIIYLLCQKISDNIGIGGYDLFFSLVIKDNTFRLEKLLHKKNIASNHENIINKLKTYEEIKKNWSGVKSKDAFDFFIGVIFNPKSEQKDCGMNYNKNIGNKGKDKCENIQFEKKIDSSDNSINEQKTNEILSKNPKNNEITDSNKPLINDDNKINSINLIDENKYVNKFLEYLKETKKLYENICQTPVLDYLIDIKGKLDLNYLRYKEDPDSFVDHLFENLNKLVYNLNVGDFSPETQGYFCFKDETMDKYIESLFSQVDTSLLFDKITSDKNFPKDNFKEPDEIIAKNAFKSRALSFEYYINYNIIIDKFHIKERPRVLYPFKSLEAIKNNEDENDNSYNLIEVDGVILEQKGYVLDLEKNVFIVDTLYKFGEFTTINNEKKVEPFAEKIIDLKENELCIIEIKNQFPPSTIKTESYIQKGKKPTTFYQMVKGLINKAKIFKRLFDLKKEKVDNIRLILFYDTIQKEKYYDDLTKAFSESFEENDDSKFLYEFQCIYIKSSYLAAGLFNMYDKYSHYSYENKTLQEKVEKINDENKKLKEDLNVLQEKLSKYQDTEIYSSEASKLQSQIIDYSKEILNLKNEVNNIKKNKLDETSKLENEIINSAKEIQKLKDETLESQQKNLEENLKLQQAIIKLKQEVNQSSKVTLEIKQKLFEAEKEKLEEIISSKDENNKLRAENISIKENVLTLEKINQDLTKNKELSSKLENDLAKSEEKKKKVPEEQNVKLSKKEKIINLISEIANSKITKEDAEKSVFEILDGE